MMVRQYDHKAAAHRHLFYYHKGGLARGDDVKRVQRGYNHLLSHGWGWTGLPKLAVDGEYGHKSNYNIRKLLWFMGFNLHKGGLTASSQDAIVHAPKHQNKTTRKRRDKRKKAHKRISQRQHAVNLALHYASLKITEKPANSNSGPHITKWQAATARGGSYLYHEPWCGIFVENMCRVCGVRTEPLWAGVAAIEDAARAHRAGFEGWTTDRRRVRRGDLVVLFGRGVHVEMVVEVHSNYLVTVGGNTSFGPGGSQSNGGCVAKRTRSYSDVHGYALVHYPA